MIAAPKVFVPVPLEVKLLKVIAPEFNVAVPFPEKTTVEPPSVNVPLGSFVNKVPVVPESVIVELFAVSVPVEVIFKVAPDRA